MKFVNSDSRKYSGFVFRLAFVAILSLLALSVVSLAQTVTSTGSTTHLGRALSTSGANGEDFGVVNAFNGTLNYTQPILSVGGRGNVGYTIPLVIDRRWTMSVWNEPHGAPWYTPMQIENFMGIKYVAGILYGRTNSEGSNCGPDEPMIYSSETRLTFVNADRSEVDLVPLVTMGAPQTGVCGGGNPPSIGNVFISQDASSIRFISDTEVFGGGFGSSTFFPSGVLTFRDGTQYRIDNSRISWMKDKNGNLVSFTYDGTAYNAKLTEIVDPKGRTISFSYDNQDVTYGSHDRIDFGGLGESELSIRISYTPLSDSLVSGETIKTYSQLFDISNHTMPNYVFNPGVVSRITYPGGQQFRYTYNNYGELVRVETPTGAAIEYDWGASLTYGPTGGLVYVGPGDFVEVFRQVLEKRVYPDGGTGGSYELKTVIGRPVTTWSPYGSHTSTRTISSSNSSDELLAKQVHYFMGTPEPQPNWTGLYQYDWRVGKEYRTDFFGQDGTTLLKRSLKAWTTVSNFQPLPAKGIEVIIEGTKALATLNEMEYGGNNTLDSEYFSHLDQIRAKSYNYKVLDLNTAQTGSFESIYNLFSTNDLASVSEFEYQYDSNYKARGILGLLVEKRVKDPGGNVVAKSQIAYDVTGYPVISAGTHTQWQDPQSSYRANPTTTRTWTNVAANQYIQTHAQFDNFGNLRKSWDAKGNLTQTDYSSAYAYAHPTSVTTPVPDLTGQNGSNQAFTASTTYDFNTGLPLTVTDANGAVTTMEYNDPMLRPTKVIAPNGHQTITEYGQPDSNGQLPSNQRFIKVKSQIDEANWKEAYSWFDGIGRTIKSQSIDSNGDVFVETEFDGLGRPKRVTNPFRVNETRQWTTNVYDNSSRVIEVIQPDGAKITTDFGISDTGVIGVTKQITDQAGKKRKGITDAIGRMVRIIEDPTGQNLVTDYTFDTLGNLRKTVQGEQSRFFMHDSLGRLLFAKQPEQNTNTNFIATDPVTGNTSWSVKYEYDNNGNITRTTDAKNVSIEGTYDSLNRITLRNYSDTTPDVSFYYDGVYLDANDVPQTATGAVKGKTTGVKSSVSKTNYTSFDNFGRLLSHQQITDGQTYNTGYAYNLSGALIEETYPSGRKVRNVLDSDGDLSMVQSKKNANSGFFIYAKHFTYDSSGAVTKMQLGNGRWETLSYNDRLQVTQIGLGATDSTQNLLKLELGYGNNQQNNGSLREQKITVPTVGQTQGFTAIQAYTYDDLNRIQSATEMIGQTETWKQTFLIDRYGNRRFDTTNNNTTTLGSCPADVCNPTISTTTNRFTTSGYVYDQNGALTNNAAGERFEYDAGNHQTAFFNASNTSEEPDATYHYSGEGRRVKKISAQETTVFVYNAGGQLVAEYSTQIETVSPQVSYLTADHLGSPRVITDQNGNVTNRKDYTAFGEVNYTAERAQGLGYDSTSDETRKGYTGYEKDAESGLDFAQARYYNSVHGRFTSVDPLTASGSIRNPQTFNRYSYVINSPYKFIDPLGLIYESPICPASEGNCKSSFRGRRADGESEYDERVQNSYDRANAQSAADKGDWDTFWSIMHGNSSLQAFDGEGNQITEPNGSTITVSAEVQGPVASGSSNTGSRQSTVASQFNSFSINMEILNLFGVNSVTAEGAVIVRPVFGLIADVRASARSIFYLVDSILESDYQTRQADPMVVDPRSRGLNRSISNLISETAGRIAYEFGDRPDKTFTGRLGQQKILGYYSRESLRTAITGVLNKARFQAEMEFAKRRPSIY